MFVVIMSVTDNHIKQYLEDGVVLIKNAFSEEWVIKVKAGIEVG